MAKSKVMTTFGPFWVDDDGNILVASGREPTVRTPLAARTATDNGWDSNGDEIDIPANAVEVHVYVDKDAFLLLNASEEDPAENGARYPGDCLHVLECKGATKLHYKNGDAGVNITVEATACCTE